MTEVRGSEQDDDSNERADNTKPPVAWGLITHPEWLLTRWRKKREENGAPNRRLQGSTSATPLSGSSKDETTPQIREGDDE
jgi:hypothetical protein